MILQMSSDHRTRNQKVQNQVLELCLPYSSRSPRLLSDCTEVTSSVVLR